MGVQRLRGKPIGQIRWRGRISPAALTGDVNDYAPAGLIDAAAIRIDGGSADRNITGLGGGARGRILWLHNIGTTNSLVLKHASGSSAAANQFIGPNSTDVTVRKNGSVEVRYDSITGAWRIAGA